MIVTITFKLLLCSNTEKFIKGSVYREGYKMGEITETIKLKAVLKDEKPIYQRGDKIKVIGERGIKNVVVRNIYSRRLEDLTFSDLEMIGEPNPNVFVKEWELEHGSFDVDKIVWVVVYAEEEKE